MAADMEAAAQAMAVVEDMARPLLHTADLEADLEDLPQPLRPDHHQAQTLSK